MAEQEPWLLIWLSGSSHAQMMRRVFRFLGWFVFAGLVLISASFIALMWSIGDPVVPEAEPSQREMDIAMARHTCKTAIENRLHDPSSADWGRLHSWPAGVDVENDARILVQPQIRARNAFGGMILTRFQCTFEGSGDAMTLIDLSEY
ncbi:hypothetical protein [Citreimonas sp.]|uniref:hypothetical protein n=1 Tax=Citreimonas sp. TaxID=3036715 RepID=UPI004058BEBB